MDEHTVNIDVTIVPVEDQSTSLHDGDWIPVTIHWENIQVIPEGFQQQGLNTNGMNPWIMPQSIGVCPSHPQPCQAYTSLPTTAGQERNALMTPSQAQFGQRKQPLESLPELCCQQSGVRHSLPDEVASRLSAQLSTDGHADQPNPRPQRKTPVEKKKLVLPKPACCNTPPGSHNAPPAKTISLARLKSLSTPRSAFKVRIQRDQQRNSPRETCSDATDGRPLWIGNFSGANAPAQSCAVAKPDLHRAKKASSQLPSISREIPRQHQAALSCPAGSCSSNQGAASAAHGAEGKGLGSESRTVASSHTPADSATSVAPAIVHYVSYNYRPVVVQSPQTSSIGTLLLADRRSTTSTVENFD
jgi:hypothetical protein